MFFAAVSNLRDLIEVFVVGVSVLGGLMAYLQRPCGSRGHIDERLRGSPRRAHKPRSRQWVPDRVALRPDHLYPADCDLMFRFVDNQKGLIAYSTVVSSLAFIAIVFFGAPPITYFFSTCGMVAFLEFAKSRNRHNRRQR